MKNSTALLAAGALCLVGGILALTYPFTASLSVEMFLGWMFLITGVLGLAGALRMNANRLWPLLMSAAMIFLGVFMLTDPLAGLLALTALVAIAILSSGITRLFMARAVKGTPAYWGTVLSGAVSIVLAIMIFAGFPASAATLLGIFLGIELILVGLPLIFLGWNMREG